MSFLRFPLLLTAFATVFALDHTLYSSSSSTCPSLQSALTVTVTHTHADVQLVTSTLHTTRTIFSTKREYKTRKQGKHSLTTSETPTTVIVTETTVQHIIVGVPKLHTKVVPLHITTTTMYTVTSTATTQLGFSIARTTALHRLAHQELYQSTPTVITGVKVIPTCTSSVVVTVSRPRAVISTIDVLVTSIATTALYATSASTITLTVDHGIEQCDCDPGRNI